MKRRVVKKWINRYITPAIKDMPKVITHAVIEDGDLSDGSVYRHVYDENHTVVNGHYVQEGCRYPASGGLSNDIKRTRRYIDNLVSSRQKVYLRVKPEYSSGYLYMRLITERAGL